MTTVKRLTGTPVPFLVVASLALVGGVVLTALGDDAGEAWAVCFAALTGGGVAHQNNRST